MPIIETYGLRGKDPGILAFAFPQALILKGPPFPPFISADTIIAVCEVAPTRFYPSKKIIHVTRDCSVQLDTPRGFLKFLAKSGVRATSVQIELLLEMDPERFWCEAKTAFVLGYFPTVPRERAKQLRGAFYRLYDAMFNDFEMAFREFSLLKEAWTPLQIFSGILGMGLKAKNVHERGDLNPYYRKLLVKNLPYWEAYRAAMLDAALSEKWSKYPEWVLLSFFYGCYEGAEFVRRGLDPIEMREQFIWPW